MWTRRISIITGVLIAFIAFASFVLSYAALRELADASGAARGWLSWLWPLVLDAAMIAASAERLRRAIGGKRARAIVASTFTLTFASVAFNVIHASGLLAQVMSAIPPIVLFWFVEIAGWQLQDELQSSVKAIAPVAPAVVTAIRATDPVARLREFGLAEPQAQNKDLAAKLGKSQTWVSRNFVAAGLRRNGHGIEAI